MDTQSKISIPESKRYMSEAAHSSKTGSDVNAGVAIQRTVITKREATLITIRVTTRPFKTTKSTT